MGGVRGFVYRRWRKIPAGITVAECQFRNCPYLDIELRARKEVRRGYRIRRRQAHPAEEGKPDSDEAAEASLLLPGMVAGLGREAALREHDSGLGKRPRPACGLQLPSGTILCRGEGLSFGGFGLSQRGAERDGGCRARLLQRQ